MFLTFLASTASKVDGSDVALKTARLISKMAPMSVRIATIGKEKKVLPMLHRLPIAFLLARR